MKTYVLRTDDGLVIVEAKSRVQARAMGVEAGLVIHSIT